MLAKNEAAGGWQVFTHGGRKSNRARCGRMGRSESAELGAGELLVPVWTKTARSLAMILNCWKQSPQRHQFPLIASGGAGTLEHLGDALEPGRADAALAASIFHFGEFRIADAKRYLEVQNIPVRL